MALQRVGIIPDRFILLNIDRETSLSKLKHSLLQTGHYSNPNDIANAATSVLNDYEHNITNVKGAFNTFIYEYNAIWRNQADVANDLARILRIRFKSNGPRRPARVILLGPPGSGRSHQAQALSERFGLVYVCTRRLLKNEISSGTKAGKEIQKSIDEGKLVPDSILTPLIDQRLRQTDCRINGWVLDGYPQTVEQINHMKELKIKPSLVCVFEQSEEVSIERVSSRRIDIESGKVININNIKTDDLDVLSKYVHMKEDTDDVVRKRCH